MKEYFFDIPEVQYALRRLVFAQDEAELWIAKQLLGESLLGTRIIVSLPVLTNETDIPSRSISPLLVTSHIAPYYQYPNLYFIYHERIHPIRISVGYTISFDTSYASYVKQVVNNQSLDGLNKSVTNTFDQIIRNDMDFNMFFYFIENFKLGNTTLHQEQYEGTSQSFWESLNTKFKENIVALFAFKDIDCRHYIETGKIRFNVDHSQAHQNSVEFTYNYYVGEGKTVADHFLELQRLLLLQMIAMYRIQYSSRKSAKHKLTEFMEFIQDKGVAIFERELVTIYKYFQNRNSVRLFNKVNMGGNQANLLEKIDNLTWDMIAIRFLERTLLLQESDFTIPLFASSDKALLEYLELFLAKATLVHLPRNNVLSIPKTTTEAYFIKEGCDDIIRLYLSPEYKDERASKFDISNDVISARIEDELEKLKFVLNQETSE